VPENTSQDGTEKGACTPERKIQYRPKNPAFIFNMVKTS
jgi:hypothetical protein